MQWIVDRIPTWDGLNRLGKSRVLQTSYVWLLVVPTAAKILGALESPIVLTGLGQGLRFTLELPFSWKLFYFSAVAISLGGIIYTTRCPKLVRSFSTFADFEAEGRELEYLRSYGERLTGLELRDRAKRAFGGEVPPIEIRPLFAKDLFWQLHQHEDLRRPVSRLPCVLFYSLGLALSTIVLVQNFVYVFEAVMVTAS